MFIGALFTIAKTWKVFVDGCTNKENVIHTHTQEYYTALKKKEILPFATTWIKLEGI